MMASHGLHTLMLLAWPNSLPEMMDVHLESKIWPQVRQWCLRRQVVKASPQLKQSLAFSSLIQNSRSKIFLRICEKAFVGILLMAGLACVCRWISSIGATAEVRTVDAVTIELKPSEEDALEGRKPGRCEGPTLSSGGRCGSGAT